MSSEFLQNQLRTAIRMAAEALPNKSHPKDEVMSQALCLITVSGEEGDSARNLVRRFIRACPQNWGADRSNAYWRIMNEVGIRPNEALKVYLANFSNSITEGQREAIKRQLLSQGHEEEKIDFLMAERFTIRKNSGCRVSAHSSTW